MKKSSNSRSLCGSTPLMLRSSAASSLSRLIVGTNAFDSLDLPQLAELPPPPLHAATAKSALPLCARASLPSCLMKCIKSRSPKKETKSAGGAVSVGGVR
eukprot:6184319-Pleurochrysis_carterae.AAC.3